jgi:hypothetical protein
MDGQPGDKSPGYYRVSLRDEVKTGFQMSKLRRHFVPGYDHADISADSHAKQIQIAVLLSTAGCALHAIASQ